ncbi:MAG: DUF3524 domain-containing protein, partial [Planctomycetales bacterium]|nr:DUF3524 domain-containing protein [Planctomycetales bacterium]
MAEVLVIEPFGGGSHRSLYQQWSACSQHRFVTWELPAVHWKWRCRHAGLTFAERAKDTRQQLSSIELVFCSSMLNVAEWRGLAPTTIAGVPHICYFHENQLTYPLTPGEKPDYHIGYSNILNLLAAEYCWFNSQYHLDEFRLAADNWLTRMPDFGHRAAVAKAFERAKVIPPGISGPNLTNTMDSTLPSQRTGCLGWVSRWEHDKQPEQFVRCVEKLDASGCEFSLILLGQNYAADKHFQYLNSRFGHRILHAGFVEDRDQYWKLLSQVDFVVSAAKHEFFGLGVIEAVSAGAIPILPRRLAYPEVFCLDQHPERRQFFYDPSQDELADVVKRNLLASEDEKLIML